MVLAILFLVTFQESIRIYSHIKKLSFLLSCFNICVQTISCSLFVFICVCMLFKLDLRKGKERDDHRRVVQERREKAEQQRLDRLTEKASQHHQVVQMYIMYQ